MLCKLSENKMFMVLNEVRSARERFIQEMDAFKSIITDPVAMIGEKFEPRREVENVSNLIFVSNNDKPLIIPPNDRRFVVCVCDSKYTNSFFLERLHDMDDEFYENLLTFFMQRDLSEYNPRKIPVTKAKKNLIAACRSFVDNFIIEYYKEMAEGATPTEVKNYYTGFSMLCESRKERVQKFGDFRNALLTKCIGNDRVKISRDGKQMWVFKLTEHDAKLYKQYLDHDEDEDEE